MKQSQWGILIAILGAALLSPAASWGQVGECPAPPKKRGLCCWEGSALSLEEQPCES